VQPKTWAACHMGLHTWALRFLGISEMYYGPSLNGPIFQLGEEKSCDNIRLEKEIKTIEDFFKAIKIIIS
jgi:hypothetical protein